MKQKWISLISQTRANALFIFLVFIYSFLVLLQKMASKLVFLRFFCKKLDRILQALDRPQANGVSQLYLMEIAFKNMAAKKTRTRVTIGGMAIGISFIVFLVSIGYGLQEVVVSRVARLDELQQTEVVPGLSADLALTDQSIAKFKTIPQVEKILPLIAVIGKVSYQNSVADLAVYAATSDYLRFSALQPIQGRIFDSNDTVFTTHSLVTNKTASQTAKLNETIRSVTYQIDAGAWLKVRSEANTEGQIIGYTKRLEGQNIGTEVWGGAYQADNDVGRAGMDQAGQVLGKWVKGDFLLWQKQICDPNQDSECEDGAYTVLRDDNNAQVQKTGYVAEIAMSVSASTAAPVVRNVDNFATSSGAVLGVNSTEPETLPIVELASESTNLNQQTVTQLPVQTQSKKEIVVNQSVLQLLNITESEAVGKVLNLSFVVVGELLDDPAIRLESAPLDYTIVGVIPDEGTPIIYVPFLDVRSLGVNRYSQLKVIAKDQNSLDTVRRNIESAGYGTVSVADTVAQIDNLFVNFRLILSILGLVALSVAALGMFNTLTVSLLERTREVGLMKAMGLKSTEIKALFLTESMIMGLYGGLLGLFLGTLAGKLLSLFLSAFSIIKGVGTIDISYLPLTFILFVLFLSIVVGLLTGYYPARRATKISALNALRYE